VLPIEPQVGDVADPHLLTALERQPLEPVGRGVVVVLGVGGDVLSCYRLTFFYLLLPYKITQNFKERPGH